MTGDILIIGYDTEQSRRIALALLALNGNPRQVSHLPDGSLVRYARWSGRYPFATLFADGFRASQVFICDDSRMLILPQIWMNLLNIDIILSRSEIPREFQISILNTDTWNSEYVTMENL